jgi:hypothetical protein
MSVRTWLLLAYRVPREPTANRVYVWRKLRRLGAIALQDAVWLLPASEQTREHFRWLASEIDDLGGQSTLWESRVLLDGQEERLVRQFSARVETGYRKILRALKSKSAKLANLARQYQAVLAVDYFKSELGKSVREALLAKKEGRKS